MTDKPVEPITLSFSPELQAWMNLMDYFRAESEKQMQKLGMTPEQLGQPAPRKTQQ